MGRICPAQFNSSWPTDLVRSALHGPFRGSRMNGNGIYLPIPLYHNGLNNSTTFLLLAFLFQMLSL